jgi:hypothetical protein
VNQTIGCLCQTFPDKLSKYSGDVKHLLIAQLVEQANSKTSKLDLAVVEGCFQGLNSCLQVSQGLNPMFLIPFNAVPKLDSTYLVI